MIKPYSPACDNNRAPILEVIAPLLEQAESVFEVGSGTGQHAAWLAAHLPHLTWYTSDTPEHHAGIRLWLEEAELPNARPPLSLDVARDAWPDLRVDAVFSANTAHIMHWHEVTAMFAGGGAMLRPGGRFLLYGPFLFDNRHTSDSNRRFDAMLRQRDPDSGIRNFENLEGLAAGAGLAFDQAYAMPANNHILSWVKQ